MKVSDSLRSRRDCYLARAKLRIRADPCLSHAKRIRPATQAKSVIALEANVAQIPLPSEFARMSYFSLNFKVKHLCVSEIARRLTEATNLTKDSNFKMFLKHFQWVRTKFATGRMLKMRRRSFAFPSFIRLHS